MAPLDESIQTPIHSENSGIKCLCKGSREFPNERPAVVHTGISSL